MIYDCRHSHNLIRINRNIPRHSQADRICFDQIRTPEVGILPQIDIIIPL